MLDLLIKHQSTTRVSIWSLFVVGLVTQALIGSHQIFHHYFAVGSFFFRIRSFINKDCCLLLYFYLSLYFSIQIQAVLHKLRYLCLQICNFTTNWLMWKKNIKLLRYKVVDDLRDWFFPSPYANKKHKNRFLFAIQRSQTEELSKENRIINLLLSLYLCEWIQLVCISPSELYKWPSRNIPWKDIGRPIVNWDW